MITFNLYRVLMTSHLTFLVWNENSWSKNIRYDPFNFDLFRQKCRLNNRLYRLGLTLNIACKKNHNPYISRSN
jgi:hypothetical protein